MVVVVVVVVIVIVVVVVVVVVVVFVAKIPLRDYPMLAVYDCVCDCASYNHKFEDSGSSIYSLFRENP